MLQPARMPVYLCTACAEAAPAREAPNTSAGEAGFEAFREAARGGANLVPLFQRILSDHLTPVLAYRCLVREDERTAPSFLFESVINGDQQVGIASPIIAPSQACAKLPTKPCIAAPSCAVEYSALLSAPALRRLD